MTKREMLVYLCSAIDQTVEHGRASVGLTKGRLRSQYEALSAIKRAVELHVPPDAPPRTQQPLFDDVTTRRG